MIQFIKKIIVEFIERNTAEKNYYGYNDKLYYLYVEFMEAI